MTDTGPDTPPDTTIAAHAADELDPQVQPVLDEAARLGLPEWSALSVESARRLEDKLFGPTDPPGVERVSDIAIDGPGGDLPLRVYHPDPEETLPVLCFFHGGLWALGTLDSIDEVCRRLARRSRRVVVSVDYRLAPDHPFPAGLEDCVAAVVWVRENGAALGADPARIAVGGTSSGGNLAAATCLYTRAFGGPSVEGQLLCYPMLDSGVDTPSLDERADGPFLTRRDVEWAYDTYLRSPVDRHNPFVSPFRADSLSGLPPAVVVTAGFDPLRDEGAAYARALADAGVPVQHDHDPAMPHGFLSLAADVDAADEALDRVAGALQNGFAPDSDE
ncbi:alpha/beta hydrolase [Salinigranum salinum]|uniref:alpha/beta hydrolase n=1 Tax=Salinigranum salinum TaxID=1364937 RepID=UPI0012606004|nr:alpha/beta hydrolase [Salinigranum salinum]